MRAALRTDAELGEMLDTPLMLNIVTLAYAGKAGAEVQAEGTLDVRRRHLFDAYIAAMFKRRGCETRYSPQQTVKWLAWLARQMVQRSQTVFYIEYMQPAILELPAQHRFYYAIVVASVGVLFGFRVWFIWWSFRIIGFYTNVNWSCTLATPKLNCASTVRRHKNR